MKKKTPKKPTAATPAKKMTRAMRMQKLAAAMKQLVTEIPQRLASKVVSPGGIIHASWPPEADPAAQKMGVGLFHGCRASDSLARLATAAKQGDRSSMASLRKIAWQSVLMINEIADTDCKGQETLKELVAEMPSLPQLVGKHPRTIREAEARIKRLGVGTKRSINVNTRATIMGGYVDRVVDQIENARKWKANLKTSGQEHAPSWIDSAQELPADKSAWQDFAFTVIREMNNGEYPDDFLSVAGKSKKAEYVSRIQTSRATTLKKQEIEGAKAAFKQAWEARFPAPQKLVTA